MHHVWHRCFPLMTDGDVQDVVLALRKVAERFRVRPGMEGLAKLVRNLEQS